MADSVDPQILALLKTGTGDLKAGKSQKFGADSVDPTEFSRVLDRQRAKNPEPGRAAAPEAGAPESGSSLPSRGRDLAAAAGDARDGAGPRDPAGSAQTADRGAETATSATPASDDPGRGSQALPATAIPTAERAASTGPAAASSAESKLADNVRTASVAESLKSSPAAGAAGTGTPAVSGADTADRGGFSVASAVASQTPGTAPVNQPPPTVGSGRATDSVAGDTPGSSERAAKGEGPSAASGQISNRASAVTPAAAGVTLPPAVGNATVADDSEVLATAPPATTSRSPQERADTTMRQSGPPGALVNEEAPLRETSGRGLAEGRGALGSGLQPPAAGPAQAARGDVAAKEMAAPGGNSSAALESASAERALQSTSPTDRPLASAAALRPETSGTANALEGRRADSRMRIERAGSSAGANPIDPRSATTAEGGTRVEPVAFETADINVTPAVRGGEAAAGSGVAVAAGATLTGGVSGSPGAGAASMDPANEYSLERAPDDPEFADELTTRMKVLVRDGVREARLQLHPAELGRLQVTITTEGDQARVSFVADTAAARDTIEQNLPRLREMFEQNGLELAQSDVGQRGPAGGENEGRGAADEERATTDVAAVGADGEAVNPDADPGSAGTSRIDTYI